MEVLSIAMAVPRGELIEINDLGVDRVESTLPVLLSIRLVSGRIDLRLRGAQKLCLTPSM